MIENNIFPGGNTSVVLAQLAAFVGFFLWTVVA